MPLRQVAAISLVLISSLMLWEGEVASWLMAPLREVTEAFPNFCLGIVDQCHRRSFIYWANAKSSSQAVASWSAVWRAASPASSLWSGQVSVMWSVGLLPRLWSVVLVKILLAAAFDLSIYLHVVQWELVEACWSSSVIIIPENKYHCRICTKQHVLIHVVATWENAC